MNSARLIVVNFNCGCILEDCVRAIARQTHRDVTFVLVDNASTKGAFNSACEIAQSIEEPAWNNLVILRLEKNSGFATANNLGMQGADEDFIALVNPDAVISETWLEECINALKGNEEVGSCATKMLRYDSPHIVDRAGDFVTAGGVPFMRGAGQKDLGQFDVVEHIFGACAGAAVYKRAMLNDIGTFDDSFFCIMEDVDLSFRAQLAGWKCLFLPSAIVHHVGGSSISMVSNFSTRYGQRNIEYVYIKNMPWQFIVLFGLEHIVYNLLSLCYFTYAGQMQCFVEAKLQVLRQLPSLLEKRRAIQHKRRCSLLQLWHAFGSGWFANKLRKVFSGKSRHVPGTVETTTRK